MKDYDVIVIGGGHAGIEAAAAAARVFGSHEPGNPRRTALFTLSLDSIGNMPCNPSIGGAGKGHLVFEVDALGGVMGRIADKCMLQCRMLNLSKGPAVHSLRFQTDRRLYQSLMKSELENIPGLDIIQSEAAEIIFDGADGERHVKGIVTADGDFHAAKTIVLACGTYLAASIITGTNKISAAPDNSLPALRLSDSLRANRIRIMRFKTGTPPRIHSDSIDYSRLEVQYGDPRITHFSADSPDAMHDGFVQRICHIAYTNAETHRIIRENLHLAPMYSGLIEGVGARYCPSIEDKIVRFADKDRHQIFVEPMGAGTKEMYLQGLSTSLPHEVQLKLIHSIRGLENARVMRYAYAIEYDCSDPLQLRRSLEFREIRGLFGAGQFNGTSGYEEAAAQGVIAGANAALSVLGRHHLTLGRASSYAGMLIDDLVTKGTNEPYRVMTARTEYRLILRQDNAAERLAGPALEAGLITRARYERVIAERAAIDAEILRIKTANARPQDANPLLEEYGSSPISVSVKLIELVRRPELGYERLAPIDFTRPAALPRRIMERAEIEVRYEGYIRRQLAEIERHRKLEGRRLPPNLDYAALKGISIEAAQKLAKFRPENIGEASRISGVSPADITVLLILLEKGTPDKN